MLQVKSRHIYLRKNCQNKDKVFRGYLDFGFLDIGSSKRWRLKGIGFSKKFVARLRFVTSPQ
jgi:hypothetical protein